jgi:hypothetical protein
MKSAWLRGGLSLALSASVLAVAPLAGGRAQESPPRPAPPAATLEQRVAALEQLAAEQKAEIERLARVADGLVEGSAKLAAAAEQALVKGFVAAGPNPDARSELLNGLNGFAESVKVAVEPPRTPELAKKKGK